MSSMSIMLTGASSGIGAALAQALATPQCHLFLAGRDQARLHTVADQCRAKGARVHVQQLDVADSKAVAAWVSAIEEETALDIVIANAGIMETCGRNGDVECADTTRRQMETNFMGCVNLAVASIPFMQKRGMGQIVFIASMSALQPVADVPGYSASKAALVAYGEALFAFVADRGITVTTICPGFIATPMNSDYGSFRPFEMSAEKAAFRIKKAIEKKKVLDVFPLRLRILIFLGRLLPLRLRRHTNKPFNFLN